MHPWSTLGGSMAAISLALAVLGAPRYARLHAAEDPRNPGVLRVRTARLRAWVAAAAAGERGG